MLSALQKRLLMLVLILVLVIVSLLLFINIQKRDNIQKGEEYNSFYVISAIREDDRLLNAYKKASPDWKEPAIVSKVKDNAKGESKELFNVWSIYTVDKFHEWGIKGFKNEVDKTKERLLEIKKDKDLVLTIKRVLESSDIRVITSTDETKGKDSINNYILEVSTVLVTRNLKESFNIRMEELTFSK